jgi:hypothetical protein
MSTNEFDKVVRVDASIAAAVGPNGANYHSRVNSGQARLPMPRQHQMIMKALLSLLFLVGMLALAGQDASAAGAMRKPFQPNPPPGPMQPNGPAVLPNRIIVPNRAPQGPNCRPVCFTQCANVECGGLNPSQCLRARQNCRVNCVSQC